MAAEDAALVGVAEVSAVEVAVSVEAVAVDQVVCDILEAVVTVLGTLTLVSAMYARARGVKTKVNVRVPGKIGKTIVMKIEKTGKNMEKTDRMSGTNMLKTIIIEEDTAMATVVQHS